MSEALSSILGRRVIKSFEPVEVSEETCKQLLDAARHAPSSFNMQPYRFYWVQSWEKKAEVARLCLGQKPAVTASVLIVAVADLSAFSSTSQAQVQWMRRSDCSEEKIRAYERDARIGCILFTPGPFNSFAALKRALLCPESVEGDWNTSSLKAEPFQMGHEEYITGMPESDDRRRSAWYEYLSNGGL